MDLSFRTKKLAKTASNSRLLKKQHGVLAKTIGLRLQCLIAADNLEIYAQLDPLGGFHKLEGIEARYAVEVSGNYRLLFDVANEPIPKGAMTPTRSIKSV